MLAARGAANLGNSADRRSDASVEQLKSQCAHLWKILEDKQKKVNTAFVVPEESRRVALLLTTELRLQHEIETLSQLSLENRTFEPRDPKVMELLVNGDVERTIQQLRDGLLFLQGEAKQTENAFNSEKTILEEHRQIHALLLKQQDSLKLNTALPHDQKVSNELRLISDQNKMFIESIKQFIHKFYPPPSSADILKLRDASGNGHFQEIDQVSPLIDTLEMLLIRSVSKKENPYIDVSQGYWPPYIELLLRSGIASQHPMDPNRIRLYEFSD